MYQKLIGAMLLGIFGVCLNTLTIVAQELTQENVTITGDSLQGLDDKNISENFSQDNTPKLNLTVERDDKPETFSTGNEFIDSLINNPNTPKPSTTQKLNTNTGDVPTMSGGKIPLFNF